MWSFPLFPDRASTIAIEVDYLFYYLTAVSLFFSLVIVVALIYAVTRYRKGSKASRKGALHDYLPIELLWTFVPLAIAMSIFVWAAKLYMDMHVAPADAMEVYVVGKQWMWKIQHPQGNQEINELHVPAGRPVKLIMTSQDVIHSFFIPAFRIKQDVIPGRYTTQWFEATTPGEYHLFCAEYCGTSHSGMIGKVIVIEPSEYERWLAGVNPRGGMASTGDGLFRQFGCQTCHKSEDTQRGPSLTGLFGKTVKLQSGRTIVADQEYLRESILNPGAKVVEGYEHIMPTYRNQLTPEQVNQLVEYIKSLGVTTASGEGTEG